jgi:hypothetical protein
MYSIQALWTRGQLALPITFVILKNRRYAALQDFAPAFGFGADDRLPAPSCPVSISLRWRVARDARFQREPVGGFARRSRECAERRAFRHCWKSMWPDLKGGEVMRIAAAAESCRACVGRRCALCVPAGAQTWPDKPIKLVVNFPARRRGRYARAQHRTCSFRGAQAAGRDRESTGGERVDRCGRASPSRPPDGYTFLVTSGGAMTVDPFLYSNLP